MYCFKPHWGVLRGFFVLRYESYTSINHVCLLRFAERRFHLLSQELHPWALTFLLFLFEISSFHFHTISCAAIHQLCRRLRVAQGFMSLTSVRDNVSAQIASETAEKQTLV